MSLENDLETSTTSDAGANPLHEEYVNSTLNGDKAPAQDGDNEPGKSHDTDDDDKEEPGDQHLPEVIIIEGPEPTAVEKFQYSRGVQIEERDGRYHYSLKANGETRELFTTDASEDGLKEADTNIRQMVDEDIASLEDEYGVKINREGKQAKARYIVRNAGESEEERNEIRDMGEVRDPTLKELAGIRAGFENSMPSNIAADPNTQLQVSFLKEGRPGAVAEFSRDENDNPVVMFYPTWFPMPATEQDVEVNPGMKSMKTPSIEYVFSHELAHHSEVTLDGVDRSDRGTYREGSGWTPIVNPETQLTDWALKGQDGYSYLLGRRSMTFYRVDENRNFLDAEGHIVTKTPEQIEREKQEDENRPEGEGKGETVPDGAYGINARDMQTAAAVRPLTGYFPNPEEMFAEYIAAYRVNAASRASMMVTSPVAYAVTQAYDQREIDAIYGKNDDGSSVFIRMPEGRLGDNTAANRKIVSDFESAERNRPVQAPVQVPAAPKSQTPKAAA